MLEDFAKVVIAFALIAMAVSPVVYILAKESEKNEACADMGGVRIQNKCLQEVK